MRALFTVLLSIPMVVPVPVTAQIPDSLPLETPRHLQFTATEGTWMSLDVSPDGGTVVFDLLGDLYTVPILGGTARRITSGQAFDQQPRYSPDGRRLVFVSDRNGSDNVWLADADGRNARALTNERRRLFISPEWTPDGTSIVVSRSTETVNRPQDYHLFLYHTDGGRGVQLTSGQAREGAHDFVARGHLGAAFGPDPRYLYLSAASTLGYGNWQLAVLDRETGRVTQRTWEPQSAMRPTVSPDGRWLVYATRSDGDTRLRLVALDGGDERWLGGPVDRDAQESTPSRDLFPGAAFTPDSRALVVAYGGKLRHIDLENGVGSEIPFQAEVDVPMGALAQFQYNVPDGPVVARRIEHPAVSPDGNRVAYVALDRIWVQPLSGDSAERLTDTGTDQFFPAWSPDGQWIAFVTWDDTTGGDVMRVRADGSGPPERLTERRAFYERVAYSPDGSRIVVARGPRSHRLTFFDELTRGRPQSTDLVWLPATGGPARRITPLNISGRWSYPHYGRPHFTGDTSRILLHDPLDGLVSVRWDGTDRRHHLAVRDWEWTYSPQVPVDDIRLAPSGTRALVLANSQVHLATLPPGLGPTVSVSLPDSASSPVPIRRLSTVGADFIGWTGDGDIAYWALGRTLTVYDLATGEQRQVPTPVSVPRDTPHGTLALRGARIITMRGDEVISAGDLVITGNRITAMGPTGTVDIPAGADVLEVSGRTILPGYVDIHAHMWTPWGVHRRQSWEYLANLAYGVTATRDPQTMTADVVTYGDRVDAGEIVGPRILSTARGIFAGEAFRSLDDARRALRRYAEHYRTETIKNYLIGDRIHRQWLIQAARELRLTPTAEGNSDFKMNLTLALDGYAGQEHSWPVFPLYQDVVQLMAQSGMVYTPTLLINYGGPNPEDLYHRDQPVHGDAKLRRFIPHAELDRRTLRRTVAPHASQWVFRHQAAQAAKVVAAGGAVALGAHGQLQGMGVHWELWLMASGGMSNHDALRVATLAGASAIGHGANFGSIEVGKLADLQILRSNPLDDIRHSLSINAVVINGRLYDTETMNQRWPERRDLPVQWWWRDTR